jgi:transcriptional regulator with XRE-family HTH domain
MSIASFFLSYNFNSNYDGGKIMPYYKRIRDLREDKDLTQAQMGKILSCSQRVYSNYERGDIDIPTSTLVKIADFHKVSVDYLLNRTDDPKMN